MQYILLNITKASKIFTLLYNQRCCSDLYEFMPITKQDHSDLILLLHNIKWLDKKLFAIYFRVTSLVTACVKEVDLMVLSPLYKAWQEAGLDIHNTIHAYHILHDVLQKIVPSKISDYDQIVV